MKRSTRDGRVPPSFYFIAIGALALAMAVALLAFGGTTESYYSVFIAIGLFLMFFGLPGVLSRIQNFTRRRSRVRRDDGKVETQTGPVEPETARVEMLVPVLGAAIGVILIAVVFLVI